jgi:3-phenylpropionate/trans-cinnamate dioxygenase ferredoxin subunit
VITAVEKGSFLKRIFACRVGDLTPGSAMTVKAAAPPVALFLTEDGEYLATQDECSHEEWSLGDDSDVEGCEVTCPLHMARFDLRTGEPLAQPATEPLRTYQVETDGDSVYVLV